jgi:phytoene synthase
MIENAETRSDEAGKVEAGGTAVPPVSPANDSNVATPAPESESPAAAVSEDETAPSMLSAGPRKTRPVAPLADPALEDMVRRGDEDRWLAAQFAPKLTRQKLMALYAFNLEVAAVADKVSDARLGEIRLQWWRDTVETIFQGGPVPDHPVVRALADVIAEAHLPLDLFDALLTARVYDLNPAPFETWADLDAYIDGSAGALMRLAAIICAPDLATTPQRLGGMQAASRAWGYIQLLRALPNWVERGRTFYPANLRGNLGIDESAARTQKDEAFYAFAAHSVLDRAVGAQKNVARYAQAFPKELFPALGYVALAPLYIRLQSSKELGQTQRPPGLFQRQVKLVFAAARGSL